MFVNQMSSFFLSSYRRYNLPTTRGVSANNALFTPLVAEKVTSIPQSNIYTIHISRLKMESYFILTRQDPFHRTLNRHFCPMHSTMIIFLKYHPAIRDKALLSFDYCSAPPRYGSPYGIICNLFFTPLKCDVYFFHIIRILYIVHIPFCLLASERQSATLLLPRDFHLAAPLYKRQRAGSITQS